MGGIQRGCVIQQVTTSEDNNLYIYGLTESGKLVFRTSRNPKYLQYEDIRLDGEIVYTNLYHFHVGFLEELPTNLPEPVDKKIV